MDYPRKDIERLIMCASKNGTITFAQIRKVFPTLENAHLYPLIGDKFNEPIGYPEILQTLNPHNYDTVILFWKKCPHDYVKGYLFKDDDLFQLSVNGLNIRYEYEERMKDRRLARTAVVASIIAAFASVIALLR